MAVHLLGAQRIFAASRGARDFRRGGAFCGGGVVALELRARADYAQGFVARRDVGLRDALPDMVRRAFRELFTAAPSWQEIRSDFVYRVFGLFVAVVAAAGLVFFYNGCRADRHLLAAVRTKDAALQASFINRARKSLMERDEAGEQLAYHIIATARATKRPEDLEAGIGALYRSFRTKPQAKQLVVEIRYLIKGKGNGENGKANCPCRRSSSGMW